MQIRFLGVGSQFTTQEYYHSNILITAPSGRRLLVDCGGDARFSLGERGIHPGDPEGRIGSIYISHLHADHIGGLEWMGFVTYFAPDMERPRLFCEERHLANLWHHSLKSGLHAIEEKCMDISDYFDCHPLKADGFFVWEDIRFDLIEMEHVTAREGCRHPSYGLLIGSHDPDGTKVFISTDAKFQPDLIASMAQRAVVLFHDCETAEIRSTVHAHYDDLVTLPAEIKARMWLYHYQFDPEQDPVADGFAGFVVKGQSFNFSGRGK